MLTPRKALSALKLMHSGSILFFLVFCWNQCAWFTVYTASRFILSLNRAVLAAPPLSLCDAWLSSEGRNEGPLKEFFPLSQVNYVTNRKPDFKYFENSPSFMSILADYTRIHGWPEKEFKMLHNGLVVHESNQRKSAKVVI